MKKVILGTFTTLMISGSVLANGVPTPSEISSSKKIEANFSTDEMLRRICVVTVTTTYSNGTSSTQVYNYPVYGSLEVATAQCERYRLKHISSAND